MMARKFERALDAATEQTLVEPNWEGILECVDMIRGRDVPVKDAVVLIQKRYHSNNPHVAHHALLVLEACVKNCGKKFHVEIATKEFMDDLKNLVIAGVPDKVKEKILELVQCWSSAFCDKPEYKIVVDTHNLLKMNGFEFPVLKEADAMFMADSAPDWMEGDNCYRCRTEFGVFTRRHHCRACGQIFCDKCSSKQMLLPQFGIEKKVRVCESCFDKRQNQRTSSAASGASADSKNRPRLRYSNSSTDRLNNMTRKGNGLLRLLLGGGSSSMNSSANPDEAARERARIQELMDKEAEELQLALAISQSEAEAKEKESRNLYSLYNGSGGLATNGATKTNGATTSSNGVYDVYKGAATLTEEMTPIKMENEEPPMDSVLAKYLDRDYWERKRTNMKESDQQSNTPRATAPPPSELSYSVSSNASQFQNENQNGCETPNTLSIAFDKMQLSKQQPSAVGVTAASAATTTINDDDEVAETSKFCGYLKDQVDTMENRMRSNLLRNRSIINDSAIHSLFAQLTNFHSNVLSRMTKLEADREYYESLQDHLAHIQEARQAVNALRDEHKRQMEARLMEEQHQRRMQMQQKLEFMRQKKHEMLFYQRHMALQRFHEQEQQIQQRRMMVHSQPSMGEQQSLSQQQQPPQQYYGMPTQLAVSSGAQQHLPPPHQWLPPPTMAPLAYSNSNPALAGATVGGGSEYNVVTSSVANSQYYHSVPQLQQVPPVSQHYASQQQPPMQPGASVAGGYAPSPQIPMYGGPQPAVSQSQSYAPLQSQQQYVSPTQQQMHSYALQRPQSDLNYKQQQPSAHPQQNLQSAGNSSASVNVPEDLLISFD